MEYRNDYSLFVMPDLIPAEDGICDRHPDNWDFGTALDSRLRGNDAKRLSQPARKTL